MSISVGDYHTLILSSKWIIKEDYEVYSFGNNKFGQLGQKGID